MTAGGTGIDFSVDSPVVCLMGPTASGKSAAAMALTDQFADRFAVEIVSVDSAQVYRGMDVGTAKPDAADRARVPHHLIDLIDPSDAYSAARFCSDAVSAIEAIRSRGNLPVLVGGTMLYFKALREGLNDLPIADPSARTRIDAEANERGWPALHAELARHDPVTAARLAPNDAQRIQRALEVWRLTGQPLSSFQRRDGGSESRAERAPYRFLDIALEPGDRSVLHDRIARRFDAMLAAGLVDEVRSLRSRAPPLKPLTPDLPSMRCVGYRQVWSHLDSQIGAAEMREQAIAATRQLAKRQLTWLRALPGRIIVDCLAPDGQKKVLEIVRRSIYANKPGQNN